VRPKHALYLDLHTGLDVDEVIRLCALEKLAGRDSRKSRRPAAAAAARDRAGQRPAVCSWMNPHRTRSAGTPQFLGAEQSIKARRKTIILTTHYMEEAELLCDEIVIMDRGRIIAQGPPRRLLHEHFAEVLLELPRRVSAAGASCPSISSTRAIGWRFRPTTWKPRTDLAGGESAPYQPAHPAGQPRGPVPGLTGTELRP